MIAIILAQSRNMYRRYALNWSTDGVVTDPIRLKALCVFDDCQTSDDSKNIPWPNTWSACSAHGERADRVVESVYECMHLLYKIRLKCVIESVCECKHLLYNTININHRSSRKDLKTKDIYVATDYTMRAFERFQLQCWIRCPLW